MDSLDIAAAAKKKEKAQPVAAVKNTFFEASAFASAY